VIPEKVVKKKEIKFKKLTLAAGLKRRKK